MKAIHIIHFVAVASCIIACGSGGGSTSAGGGGSEEPAGAEALPGTGTGSRPESEMIHRTVVHLFPDGTETVWSGLVTQEQQRREIALRTQAQATRTIGSASADEPATSVQGNEHVGTTAEALTHDGSCADSDLWMWDSSQNASCAIPGADQICFYGSGNTDLSNWCRVWVGSSCVSSWFDSVYYLWPGNEDGYLWDGVYSFDKDYFYASGSCQSAVNTWAKYLYLTD